MLSDPIPPLLNRKASGLQDGNEHTIEIAVSSASGVVLAVIAATAVLCCLAQRKRRRRSAEGSAAASAQPAASILNKGDCFITLFPRTIGIREGTREIVSNLGKSWSKKHNRQLAP